MGQDNENELVMPEGLREQVEEEKEPSAPDDPVDFLAKHNLYPTDIEQSGAEFARLTLNGQLEIRSISLPSDQVPYVEWPRSERDKNDDNNTIWFEDMDVKKALSDVVSNQLTSSEDPASIELEVDRFHAYEQDNLLGFLDVSVNGQFNIKGCKLMVTDGEEWISWPAEKGSDGEWYDLFSVPEELSDRLMEQLDDERS